ncbi:MAG: chemoreceptor glutamine deamidase CheD [Desulfuromonas sp.]|uniref:chemotaxis protein CheD n=1 Tax=Desulfuromonas sp. TaxID=892 RepID=UPI000CC6D869|nr:chemotaxis protein CheD [Desulfuromonas sp.]PLX83523.1 MAG: chemoreceptor glutamine deamidase CheD [Desulfuromonas sp.]
MTSKVRVGISEYRVAEGPAVLVTYGLGSCLGIVLYDARVRVGGLAHTLLPRPRPGMEQTRMTKFVDAALRLMLEELLVMGAERERLQARIVGGANMFEPLHGAAKETIGERNVRAARETLRELGIPLLAEDVGGRHGRTVEFDLGSGEVRVRSMRGEHALLPL